MSTNDLAGLHAQARKLVLSLRAGVERLEAAESAGGPPPPALAADLAARLAQLQRLSADMDSVWRMQSLREAPAARDLWRRKVEAVAEDADDLRAALGRAGSRARAAHAEEAQRQELLQRRAAGGPLVNVDAEAAARRSVANSRRIAEEAVETGAGALAAMAAQRDVLKRAHRGALDVLHSVGLSDSLLRVVERRVALDKLIAYGGMAGVLLFVGGLWWWLKT